MRLNTNHVIHYGTKTYQKQVHTNTIDSPDHLARIVVTMLTELFRALILLHAECLNIKSIRTSQGFCQQFMSQKDTHSSMGARCRPLQCLGKPLKLWAYVKKHVEAHQWIREAFQFPRFVLFVYRDPLSCFLTNTFVHYNFTLPFRWNANLFFEYLTLHTKLFYKFHNSEQTFTRSKCDRLKTSCPNCIPFEGWYHCLGKIT